MTVSGIFRRAAVAASIAVLWGVASPSASIAGEQNAELARANELNLQVVQLYNRGRYADAVQMAQQVLEIREKALGPDHSDVAESLNNLAAPYLGLGRYTEAERLFRRSLAIREKALGPDHPNVAEGLNNLAALYLGQGRYTEAELLFKRSLAIREKALGPDHPIVGESLNNLGAVYNRRGRYAETVPLLTRSLAIREKALGPDHPLVGQSLNNLAAVYDNQRRYAEAEPLLKRGLAIQEKALGPDHPDVGTCINNLALLYQNQGRYAEAEPLYKRSLAIREKALGPDHPDVAQSLNNLAGLYDTQDDYAAAEPLYKRGLAINEKALGSDHPVIANNLVSLAGMYRQQHRIPEAYALSRRAVDIIASRIAILAGARSGGAIERRQFHNHFRLHVALAAERGQAGNVAAETLPIAQLANASTAARAVAGMAARFASGNDELAAVIRQRQDLAQRWEHLDRTVLQAVSNPPGQRDAKAELTLRRQIAETGAQLDALDARIAREFPAYTELSNPKPLELAEVQAMIAPDEAMLVYLVGDKASWLWALRHDRAELYTLDIGGKALTTEVSSLRERLDPAANPKLEPFDATRANALYGKIMAPAAAVLAGARNVFVVPDGALESLPLGVLVTKPPAANPETLADHREIAWLARDYALTTLPSIGTLRALRSFASLGRATSPFVGIGNPTLSGDAAPARGINLATLFRGRIADVDAVRRLPLLPETADELRAVAKDLGATDNDLYLAERASEPLLRQAQLDRYRVVEFATHGLMSGEIEGLAEPALVLTPPKQASADDDGLLTASKVATLKLDADWVVLSACNTAAADGSPDAGGLSGLAKAFFYAGARSILVAHWSVASQATVKLVTGAFEALKKDPSIGRAEALRRAEMAMLDPASPPEFAHPLVWAPFVLAGEGGAGR